MNNTEKIEAFKYVLEMGESSKHSVSFDSYSYAEFVTVWIRDKEGERFADSKDIYTLDKGNMAWLTYWAETIRKEREEDERN